MPNKRQSIANVTFANGDTISKVQYQTSTKYNSQRESLLTNFNGTTKYGIYKYVIQACTKLRN